MPTHAFTQKSFYHTLATGEKLPPPSRSTDPEDLHQCAPLHSVTVNDAIGDLVSGIIFTELNDPVLSYYFSEAAV
jgi:hypothetical protein